VIYKKYEITKQKDVLTGKGFLHVVHSPDKDDYFFDAKRLQTCKNWIDVNPYPVKPPSKRKVTNATSEKSQVRVTKRRKRRQKRR
jgi:hypothetical protein